MFSISQASLSSVPEQDLISLIERVQACYEDLQLVIKESFGLHDILRKEIDNPEYGPNTKRHLIQKVCLVFVFYCMQ